MLATVVSVGLSINNINEIRALEDDSSSLTTRVQALESSTGKEENEAIIKMRTMNYERIFCIKYCY